jgi:phosphoribosylformimino-5-aminoimidazole carboxamide ribotide isomerase
MSLTDASIIASGGVASLDDVLAVRRIGCAGAIVGRALYDGTLDLRTILAAVSDGAAGGEARDVATGAPGQRRA